MFQSTTQASRTIEECYGQEPDWDAERMAEAVRANGSIQPHDFRPPPGSSGFYFHEADREHDARMWADFLTPGKFRDEAAHVPVGRVLALWSVQSRPE